MSFRLRLRHLARMVRWLRTLAISTSVVVSTDISSALARPKPTILLVYGSEAEAAPIQRLRGELMVLGLDVEQTTVEPENPSELDDLARKHDAVAAIHVLGTGESIQVWIADRVTGKTLLREFGSQSGSPKEVLALQAVELLRASLVELQIKGAAIRETAPAPAPELARMVPDTERSPSSLYLTLGPASLWSPGAVATTAGIEAGVSWRGNRWVSAEVFGLAPVVATTIKHDRGQIDFRPLYAGAGLGLELLPLPSRVRATLTLGYKVVWVQILGTARSPFLSDEDPWLLHVPFFGAGGALNLTSALQLGVKARLGWSSEKPVLLAAGEEVTSWARPLVNLQVALSAALN